MKYATTRFRWKLFPALALTLLGAALAQPAAASSIVPPRDLAELSAHSDAVVLARAGSGTVFSRGALILTATSFEILDVIHGAVPAHLTVETVGGVLEGQGLTVAGSPTFEAGHVYLLFLARREGAWQPRMLSYGLLERTLADDGTVLLNHVAEHHDLQLLRRPDGASVEPVGTYLEAPLLRHLREVEAGAAWNQALTLAPETLRPQTHDAAHKTSGTFPEPCRYLSHGGYPIRWSRFDDGGTVNFYHMADGDEELGAGATSGVVQSSIDKWTNIAGSDIGYHWAGTVQLGTGEGEYTPDCTDGSASPNDIGANQGLIQFNDPCNEIADLIGCNGTLAFGGAYFQVGTDGRHEHQGMEWNTAVIGFLVVNNDVAACLSQSQYRIMVTHELGHTLGLGHISIQGGRANMNPSCCTDVTEVDETCALFAYSDQEFITLPDVIALTAPADESSDQPISPQLSWREDADTDVYQLQIATDTRFRELVYDRDNLTATQVEVGPLESGTRYYWRVRGFSAAGEGPWSSTWEFRTEYVIPVQVKLTKPASDDNNVRFPVDFAWEKAPGAQTYQLQVSTDAAFATIVYEASQLDETADGQVSLDPRTTYFWRVRGANALGQGAWSETRQFATRPPRPGRVGLTAPDHDALDQPGTLELAWQSDAEADTYQLQLSLTEDFAERVFDRNDLTEPRQEVGPLAATTLHYWRVRALNGAGGGDWSEVRRFTTALRAPDPIALTRPEDGVEEQPRMIGFAWQPDVLALHYQLQLATDAQFETLFLDQEIEQGTALEIDGLGAATTYFWRVRGVNAVGVGAWSEARWFSTALYVPGAVVLLTPEDEALDQPGIVSFSWQAEPSSRAYDLQVSLDDGFTNVVFDETLTATQHDVGPLAYLTEHFWRVRGRNSVGAGPWSERRSLTLSDGTAIEPGADGVPEAFRFHPNYPNPFNPETTLRFDVAERAVVTLVVYDMLGRAVETLVNGPLPAGEYRFVWDATDRPSGVYLARFQAGHFVQTRQLLLLK